jgi:hypothetical protein
MPELFPPGGIASPLRCGTQPEPTRSLWRWTAVLIHALRQALCPSPGLLALFNATKRGDLLQLLEEGPRMRQLQPLRLRDLLKAWILG